MNKIADLTSGCEREDCVIEDCGATTTLLASMSVYDKRGSPIKRTDPNTVTARYRCLTCGRGWRLEMREGHTDVVTEAA